MVRPIVAYGSPVLKQVCSPTENVSLSLDLIDTLKTTSGVGLAAPATQNIGFLNATDINSSDGQTVYSFLGVTSNTLNWAQTQIPQTRVYTF